MDFICPYFGTAIELLSSQFHAVPSCITFFHFDYKYNGRFLIPARRVLLSRRQVPLLGRPTCRL